MQTRSNLKGSVYLITTTVVTLEGARRGGGVISGLLEAESRQSGSGRSPVCLSGFCPLPALRRDARVCGSSARGAPAGLAAMSMSGSKESSPTGPALGASSVIPSALFCLARQGPFCFQFPPFSIHHQWSLSATHSLTTLHLPRRNQQLPTTVS